MLAAVGYWGFKTHSAWWFKILFGVGLPLLIAILWGLYIAPKATRPLSGASRLVLELILLGSGAVSLFASGQPGFGWIYLIALFLNEILLFACKQWNAPVQ